MALPLQCRVATPDDLDELTNLFDLYRQFYQCTPDQRAAFNWLRENLKGQRSTIFVADLQGRIAGFTQLYPALCSVELAPYFVLYDLFVEKSFRRQGVARALMNHAAQWAMAAGASRLDLETAHDNIDAQALYTSLGYERDNVFLKYSLALAAPAQGAP